MFYRWTDRWMDRRTKWNQYTRLNFFGKGYKNVICKLILQHNMSISWEIALISMPQKIFDDKSALGQVMAWCCQAMSQCCPRSMSPYGITRPQWVKVSIMAMIMMTSSNGNIFRVTGPLCGEFTVLRWIPHTKGQWRGALMFSLIYAWTNAWVNNREAGDLRRYRVHFDVTVMTMG